MAFWLTDDCATDTALSPKKGAHLYADGGLETFKPHFPGWAQLEVECNSTTKLQTGRDGRYCVKGTGGELCMKVRLRALWVLINELPDLVKYG